MKKSEFIAARRRHWEDGRSATSLEQRLLWDVDAAEHAGVVWDPEEEPLPERLAICGGLIKTVSPPSKWSPWTVAKIAPRGDAPVDPFRIAAEAVRRWNINPALRRLADDWRACGDRATAAKLDAILDGKEGE